MRDREQTLGRCKRSILLVLFSLSLCSCSTTVTGKPVGRLTVEESVRLYMKHPSVVEWLRKTNAQAVYFPDENYWKINLKDGWVFYTEAKGADGLLYVNQIAPQSNDPEVTKRLLELQSECEKTVREKRK